MKRLVLFLFLGLTFSVAACTPLSPPHSTSTPTQTSTPTVTPTPTASPTPLPTATLDIPSYAADIQPIFTERCIKCHSGDNPPRGLRLIDYEHVLAGVTYRLVIDPSSLKRANGCMQNMKAPTRRLLIARQKIRIVEPAGRFSIYDICVYLTPAGSAMRQGFSKI